MQRTLQKPRLARQPANRPRKCCRHIPLALILAILCVGPLAAAEAPSSTPAAGAAFHYRSPTGTEFVVTDEGLSEIRVGQHQLASGGWSLFNAEGWFKAGSGRVNAATKPGENGDRILARSLEILDHHRARVRQAQKDVLTTTIFSFDGEDVLISARVENNHSDEPLNVVGFHGLQFHFGCPPTGLMMVQHITYFQANGLRLCHPGDWSKIGGSYATDDTIGVGVSPWKTRWNRTLLLWDYADWNPDKREALPDRNLIYFAVAPIPPRGARTIDLKLRVSRDRDWKHLLEPYREHFQATFGPVRYKANDRWIATDYLNHSIGAIGPTNPYGFQGDTRRFDTAEGVKKFCDAAIPVLQRDNGQGVILWGQGGENPRGAMYRPDFDVLPPEVEANWSTLAERFHKAGLKLGVCTRPADMAVQQDWKSDEIIEINADDPGHQAMLLRRFQTMIKRGCTLFYLDSFGSDLEHAKLMRFLREQLGPNILTFCEHQCDAIMPYSGGYSETTFHPRQPGEESQYDLWSGQQNWEIYRWLAPGSQMAARFMQDFPKKPDWKETPDEFFYRHRITPLVPTNDFFRGPELLEIACKWRDTGWEECVSAKSVLSGQDLVGQRKQVANYLDRIDPTKPQPACCRLRYNQRFKANPAALRT